MERQKKPAGKILTQEMMIKAFSALSERASLLSRLGTGSFGGDRNIYQALGYPETEPLFADYYGRYKRQDIAKAIIDRPVKATWQGPLELIEAEEENDTEFEETWAELDKKLKLKNRLTRVDRLTRLGKYGVLLLGLDDVKKQEDFQLPVNTNRDRKLLYVKPFTEATAKIDTYVEDPKDIRFGLPLMYAIQVQDSATKANAEVRVHYSRVVHVLEDALESEVEGLPCLEVVYNRLLDLEKLIGGDAEMFWKGARPGYTGSLKDGYTATTEFMDDLQDQMDEFDHNLRRFLINDGVDLKALEQQLADPKNHVDIQIQMISAVTGIPKRILTGSERGELSSAQDSEEWKDFVQARRDDHAEPDIVRPFVDRLIEYGVLPEPSNGYTVKWQDLYSTSEKERTTIGKNRAEALREYTTNPTAMATFPPKAFMEICMGLTAEQITLITAMIHGDVEKDAQEIKKILDIIETSPEPKATPAPGTKLTRQKPAVE